MNVDAARRALLADARADADAILAEGGREAESRLATARQEAERIVQAGHDEGARDAEDRLARQRAASRREARELVLVAERRTLAELRDAARAAVLALHDDDTYPALLERLREVARAELGPDARIVEDPGGEPGLVATDDSRRIDCRLRTLADREVDRLGAEVSALWA